MMFRIIRKSWAYARIYTAWRNDIHAIFSFGVSENQSRNAVDMFARNLDQWMCTTWTKESSIQVEKLYRKLPTCLRVIRYEDIQEMSSPKDFINYYKKMLDYERKYPRKVWVQFVWSDTPYYNIMTEFKGRRTKIGISNFYEDALALARTCKKMTDEEIASMISKTKGIVTVPLLENALRKAGVVDAENLAPRIYYELASVFDQLKVVQPTITRIGELKTCPNCGVELQPDSQFCHNCGAYLKQIKHIVEYDSDMGT